MKINLKIKEKSLFEQYAQSLSEADMSLLSEFFSEFSAHCMLPSEEKSRLRSDFESALLYYTQNGTPLDTALSLLDPKALGGFYSRPPVLWFPLDDAAKVYPLSMKHGQMAIFRMSVYLTAPVVPELLQMALTFTIKRFPSFATTVKKGFFWHYLDTTKRRFVVKPDTGLPCRPIRIAYSGSQSFRVMYYKNRISVEFFHVLTDGMGGMTFLKTLTATYLRLTGLESSNTQGVLDIEEVPSPSEMTNEFGRADKTEKVSGFMGKPAVQMSGKVSKVRPYQILHFKIANDTLIAAAKSKGASVTAYVLAQMFLAGRYATDAISGEMNIQVPVNMRKYYPSNTLRNFAMYCGIRLPINEITSTDHIIPLISQQLSEKASKESMSEMMNATQSMTNALRYIPLFIKAAVAGVVYSFLGDKVFSNTLTNLGVTKMPKELSDHVESMDAVLGPTVINRACCAMISYGSTTTLTITKITADPTFEEKLYELLCNDGVKVCVEGSAVSEG